MNSTGSSGRLNMVQFSLLLGGLAALLLLIGVSLGSTGWHAPWGAAPGEIDRQILWDIRLPRTLGAWLVGALLGVAGAVAQGLFRNPLAEPYLLGSASGAALLMTLMLVVLGQQGIDLGADGIWRFGLTGAAFLGALGGVLLTLVLARGAAQTMRLLLAGVVVGVVLGACTSLIVTWSPQAWRAMQAFNLGSTSLLGWSASSVLALALVMTLLPALLLSRVLDALSLGDETARSMGLPLAGARGVLVAVLALATAAAVAQSGLIAFVGLAAPHMVRRLCPSSHRGLLWASALVGGVLLQLADVLARCLWPPQEVPVGVLTSIVGGLYLLWLMHRRPM